jgi:hypothetical protein
MRYPGNMSDLIRTIALVTMLFALTLPISALSSTAMDLDKLPDPTRSTGRTTHPHQPQASKLVLQSILHSGQRRRAIINGQIKTIGSWINGNQIKDIRHDSVVVARNGRLHVLHLSTIPDIKSTAMTQ